MGPFARNVFRRRFFGSKQIIPFYAGVIRAIARGQHRIQPLVGPEARRAYADQHFAGQIGKGRSQIGCHHRKIRLTSRSTAAATPNIRSTCPAGWTQTSELNAALYKKDAKGNPLAEVKSEKSPFSSPLFSVLGLLLPLILFGAFWIFIMRQSQSGAGQAMSFGKSKAKRLTDSSQKVTFADVAGVDEAKQELQEVIDFLKNPEKFQALGAKIPRGVLLLGNPGTGKTLLARAVAGEAGVPFFHISGSDFVEMFVGVGASRVRDLFDQAKAHRPAIVFIDEIDAVGRHRGAGMGGGHDEREQTLNQLLVEMDGFDPNSGVILMAATNRPDVLDPALTRPGRFDRQIIVDNPDSKGRLAILGVHAKGKPIDSAVDLDVISRRTAGFSGADLANLVNEAALLAARRNKQQIGEPEFEESIERVISGPERKSRIIQEREKTVIALSRSRPRVAGQTAAEHRVATQNHDFCRAAWRWATF